jgi:ketosteroid isomerase-like protein
MKKYLSFVVIFCFVSTIALTQTKDENSVARAVEKFRLALINGDEKDLQKLVIKKLSYGHSAGNVEGKKEFIENLVSKRSDFVGITITDQTIAVTGKIAVVRHIMSAETNDNNVAGRVKLKVLLVFIRKQGRWKLAARQAIKPIIR